jgi:hypothetical protein
MGNASTEGGGVTGTRSLGVRELTYKMAFLASSVQVKPLSYRDCLSLPCRQLTRSWA